MPRKNKNVNGKRKYLNLFLSSSDYERAVQIAEERGSKRSELVYPLVIEYLMHAAKSSDWLVIKDPAALARDEHWGTAAEARNPRALPNGLQRGIADKKEAGALLQQSMAPDDLKHLRDIERYYRVSVADLVVAALNRKKVEKEKVEKTAVSPSLGRRGPAVF